MFRAYGSARPPAPPSPNIGWILYLADRPEEAVAHLRQTLALNPDFGLAHLNLGLAYLSVDAVDPAIGTFETLRSLWGDAPAAMSLLGHAYARAERESEARLILDTLRRQQPRTPFHEALLHIGLGEHAPALDALEAALDQRSGLVLYLGAEPLLDPLRAHPRFKALLAQAGLSG